MCIYWFEQSESDVPFGDEWLSGSERARLDTLRVPKRRADWRLGRWTAKCGVSGYLHLPRDPEALAAVEVRPAISGAPEIFLHGEPAPVALSLSHSRGTGLCTIAPASAEVGCDLEAIEPRSPAFRSDYFTSEELDLIERTPPSDRDRMVTLLWSAKESTLKALRCGLRSDTRAVNASPQDFLQAPDEEWHRLCAGHIGGRTFDGWWRDSDGLIRTVVFLLNACGPAARQCSESPRTH
ncbi:MAG: 4'-phosphopantetheinyl transferase superfamily protein [Terracidiphilus sp.]|nr:4'-phosphopantetheinyl transferase superfamily protein [Terracidiphilus sp.]